MSVVGVLSGGAGESDDGVAMDADEAPGGADAATLVEVLKHGVGLLLGQMAAVERRAFAFGEAGAAAVAVELSELLVLAEVAADREVAGVTSAVERTVRILAAEAREVVHGVGWLGMPGRDETSGWKRKTAPILRRIPHHGSTDLGHHPRYARVDLHMHRGTGEDAWCDPRSEPEPCPMLDRVTC
jgi:hypothetical protein